ncbi:hypothetical protein FisN_7Lh009 [Fistulifera solaris]|uniref:Uncharacterized protein n=1 Tax=Fistulifera solaris TaxID=1519565 RepID=A0A1Z5JCB9_FISSO|nr:hypothetical protein FisN_7Lh009 [Fistulifera solaris]|eukprot:GAX11650.1 hypothetical protein FisN_7Lh009 [Fistulifera solaris]
MSDAYDYYFKNQRVVQDWETWFATEELENDPSLNPRSDINDNDKNNAAFFREIDKMPDLLDESSSTTRADKLSPLSIKKSSVSRELKKSLSFPPSSTKSQVTVDFEQSLTPKMTPKTKSPTSSLRRSQRTSTQKKTRATEERLKLRASSMATPKMTSNDISTFLSPEFDVMIQSAMSNSLSTNQMFEKKLPFSLMSLPIIPTPSETRSSPSLLSTQIIPGLEEWNQLYLSRPQMGSQFSVWKWLDAVRDTAFRYPLSVVKPEKSRLDSWTKASNINSTCDMSILQTDDVVDDAALASFLGTLLDEDESSPVSLESKTKVETDGKEIIYSEGKSGCKTGGDIVANPHEEEKDSSVLDAMASMFPEGKDSPNSEQIEKVVSFKDSLSPTTMNKAATSPRKTPHWKASQPTPRKTVPLNPSARGYFPGTPFVDKAHYPTTPCGCDSPSVDIPDYWVQLFLDRPDPFECNTKDVLSWLSEVSDINEHVNVKIPTIAVSSMASVSSMNDTPMPRKLNAMSPVFSPMSLSFGSPLPSWNNE